MNHRITNATKAGIAVMACAGMLSLGATVSAGEASAVPRSAATKTVVAKKPKQKTVLFVNADTVSIVATSDCHVLNIFPQGAGVLFRIKVFTGATGNTMTTKSLKSVFVTVAGKKFPAAYGTHKTDKFWSVVWTIPKTQPLGVVPYTITAMADSGAVGHYVPFNVTASDLTVVAAS
jgi:hypothetical protein